MRLSQSGRKPLHPAVDCTRRVQLGVSYKGRALHRSQGRHRLLRPCDWTLVLRKISLLPSRSSALCSQALAVAVEAKFLQLRRIFCWSVKNYLAKRAKELLMLQLSALLSLPPHCQYQRDETSSSLIGCSKTPVDIHDTETNPRVPPYYRKRNVSAL